MKKIGILHGKERSFPQALIDRINAMQEPGITAEPVDGASQLVAERLAALGLAVSLHPWNTNGWSGRKVMVRSLSLQEN